MHPSILPYGRGQSPISNTILDGLTASGISLFELTDEADAGPILGSVSFELSPPETASSVYAKVLWGHFLAGRDLAMQLASGTLQPQVQAKSGIYLWPRVTHHEELVDSCGNFEAAETLVRALGPPYQGARTLQGTGRVLQIHRDQPNPPKSWTRLNMPGWSCLVELEDEETYQRVCAMTAQPANCVLDAAPWFEEPSHREISRSYAGVLLFDDNANVYLQKRDDKPGIANPGMVTLFGGVAEKGESPTECALRELNEELELELSGENLELLGYLDKVERDMTLTRCAIFVAQVEHPERLVLHEGAAIECGLPAAYGPSTNTSAICQAALKAAVGRVPN
jgi:ADP-ribose pyrophosphatase YjhB (NUDIX family)